MRLAIVLAATKWTWAATSETTICVRNGFPSGQALTVPVGPVRHWQFPIDAMKSAARIHLWTFNEFRALRQQDIQLRLSGTFLWKNEKLTNEDVE
jgi:hypothetical protein